MRKFKLVDENGKVVRTDLITGKANTKGTKFKMFLPPAIDNIVTQLVNNQDFLNNVKTKSLYPQMKFMPEGKV